MAGGFSIASASNLFTSNNSLELLFKSVRHPYRARRTNEEAAAASEKQKRVTQKQKMVTPPMVVPSAVILPERFMLYAALDARTENGPSKRSCR